MVLNNRAVAEDVLETLLVRLLHLAAGYGVERIPLRRRDRLAAERAGRVAAAAMDVDGDALFDTVLSIAHDWQGFAFGVGSERRIATTGFRDAVVAGLVRMDAGDQRSDAWAMAAWVGVRVEGGEGFGADDEDRIVIDTAVVLAFGPHGVAVVAADADHEHRRKQLIRVGANPHLHGSCHDRKLFGSRLVHGSLIFRR